MNINETSPIVYDKDILSKIKEMIENGLCKLESFIKLKANPNLNFYNEMDKRFNDIAKSLEKYDFFDNEFNYFLSITSKILYVLEKNCEDKSFGHCDYALELFDFFIEIWNVKLKLINNYSKNELKNYEKIQNEFKDLYWEYEREFYLNIHESNGDFTQKEIYNIHERLRK